MLRERLAKPEGSLTDLTPEVRTKDIAQRRAANAQQTRYNAHAPIAVTSITDLCAPP